MNHCLMPYGKLIKSDKRALEETKRTSSLFRDHTNLQQNQFPQSHNDCKPVDHRKGKPVIYKYIQQERRTNNIICYIKQSYTEQNIKQSTEGKKQQRN